VKLLSVTLLWCLVSWLSLTSLVYAAPFQVTSAPLLTNSDNGLLTRVLEFTTDQPTRTSFLLEGEGKKWLIESHELATQHRIPVMGMTFGQNYSVSQIKVEDGVGSKLSLNNQFNFATGSKPFQIHDFIPVVSDKSKMEPGLTIFHGTNQTVGVDADGAVRWHYGQNVWNIHRASNGNFLGFLGSLSTANILREFDVTGRTVREWYPGSTPPPASQLSPVAVPIAAQGLHHDVWLMENTGNILTIDRRIKTVNNYPTSATDPNAPLGTVDLSYDLILEVDTAGNIVHQWDTSQIIDERRVAFDMFAASSPGQVTWIHANGLYHDPNDDSIVVSSRVQDAVFKFDRATGDLKWILANHEGWGPEFQDYLLTPISGPGEEFEWSYHQHNPTLLEDGNIILFDNGTYRTTPFDGNTPMAPEDSYSRIVEYDIDETNMTVTQVWSYGKDADEVLYTALRGGVDLLPETGNILRADGVISKVDGVTPNPNYGRIQELTRDGEIVFDLLTSDPFGGAQIGPYRADRVQLYDPALYTVSVVPCPTSGTLAFVAMIQMALLRRRG
jgi:arylsulfate sulfotransferase